MGKIGPHVSADQRAANLLDSRKSNYDKAVVDKLLPSLSDSEQALIRESKIKKVRHTDKIVFFESIVPVRQLGHMEYEQARYWYRTMTREDYLSLEARNQVVTERENDYGGIAPNYAYCVQTKYYGNNKKGTHIVEFTLNVTGSAFCEEIKQREMVKKGKRFRLATPKGEGGGSIGLGQSGMYEGTAGEVFNEKLKSGEIKWRLVAFRCTNLLPNHELYY